MTRRRTLFTGAALAATSVLVLTGCAAGSDPGSTAPESTDDFGLIEAGTLTVCSDVPYPPFEDFDDSTESGFTGFDIDLLTAIADKLGLGIAVQDVGFDALQSGTILLAETCDMGASAMTITEERKANIDFSDPYYDSLQSLLVPADSDIASIDDLAGKTVGVQQGTTGEIYTTENAPEGTEIVRYPSDGELWPAIQAGQIDAILQDLPVNVEHVRADDAYTIIDEYDTEESYGFAFAKGEKTQLLEAVNGALADLRDDGTYQEIYDSYFAAE